MWPKRPAVDQPVVFATNILKINLLYSLVHSCLEAI